VTEPAIKRGIHQLGTVGSGNHCLEVQVVSNDRIFDLVTAAALGITGEEQIVVRVQCGSRGFGHQVASDYLTVFEISIAPLWHHREGSSVGLCAVSIFRRAGVCFHYELRSEHGPCNRQVIIHQIREAFATGFGRSAEAPGMEWVYDVARNIAKVERFPEGDLVVYREGATKPLGLGVLSCQKCFDRQASRSSAGARWSLAHRCW